MKEVIILKEKQTVDAVSLMDFSTTATIREAIEALAEEPVIISVPVGGDASEFE